jgi:CheY-like chemotaxis protein
MAIPSVETRDERSPEAVLTAERDVRSGLHSNGGDVPVVTTSPGLDRAPLETSAFPQPRAAYRRKVLVVDDNRDLAESLAMVLRLWGHDVVVAYDGPSALAAARARPPDVVFLDIGLPQLDGFEVAQRLRADSGLGRTRIVAVTGYGQDEDRRRSQAVGIDIHLTKPVDPIVLQRLLVSDI